MARRLRHSTPHVVQTFAISIALRQRLAAAVARHDLSASELIRRALLAFLRRDEKKTPKGAPGVRGHVTGRVLED
jgi:hypothetical protein